MRVPRVLSEAAELQRAVALVRVRVLHRDVVLCVSQASLRVSCGCFVVGALRGSHTEGQQPPNPKGWTSRSRRTNHLDRPPGRPCRESPGLFVLSLSHYVDRAAWVVSPRKRVSCLIKRQRC